ncbi:MAG TPA: ankyrin repeat domain-containing protein [Gaiella sp.]|nr:ankyrin repeat domain-containing protein [Gaiella sp.]
MIDAETAFGTLRSDDDRCAVAFRRLYDFTAEELWSALTDPEQLGRWLARAQVDPGVDGQVTLDFEGGSTEGGRILTWDEPHVLEYEWRFSGEEDSVVRFELHPQEFGTLLVLDHRRLGRSSGAGYSAGWHAHLDALARLYEFSDDAWTQRYEELLPAYRAQADELGWNRKETSPVREALYRGDRAAAEAAAEGAELDLFDAAALGRPERLRELLDAEPQLVHELSDDGFTALHLACFGAGADTVRLLVERGAPLERLAEAPFARVRPLGTAAFAGNLDAARILLDAGADPNGTDSGEHRPLQTAEANGNEALASLLREHGATLPV